MKKQRLAILVFNRLLVPQNVSWQHGNTARAMMHGHVLNVARHISLSFAYERFLEFSSSGSLQGTMVTKST